MAGLPEKRELAIDKLIGPSSCGMKSTRAVTEFLLVDCEELMSMIQDVQVGGQEAQLSTGPNSSVLCRSRIGRGGSGVVYEVIPLRPTLFDLDVRYQIWKGSRFKLHLTSIVTDG